MGKLSKAAALREAPKDLRRRGREEDMVEEEEEAAAVREPAAVVRGLAPADPDPPLDCCSSSQSALCKNGMSRRGQLQEQRRGVAVSLTRGVLVSGSGTRVTRLEQTCCVALGGLWG